MGLDFTYNSRNIKDMEKLAESLDAKGYNAYNMNHNYIDTAKVEGLIRKKRSHLTVYTNAVGPTGHHVAMLNYSGGTKDIMELFSMVELHMENIDTSKRPISFSE